MNPSSAGTSLQSAAVVQTDAKTLAKHSAGNVKKAEIMGGSQYPQIVDAFSSSLDLFALSWPHSAWISSNCHSLLIANYIYLEYEEGDAYKGHCGFEPRRSIIMIICKPGETEVRY